MFHLTKNTGSEAHHPSSQKSKDSTECDVTDGTKVDDEMSVSNLKTPTSSQEGKKSRVSESISNTSSDSNKQTSGHSVDLEKSLDENSERRDESVSELKSLSDITLKRQKFVRQKSFDLDSDDTDMESIFDPLKVAKKEKMPKSERKSNRKIEIVTKSAKKGESSSKKGEHLAKKSDNSTKKVENSTQTLESSVALTKPLSEKVAKISTKTQGTKKRPDLTIKIYDSSFDMVGTEDPNIAEAFCSPNLHISGISISRSPPGITPKSANLSPKYQIQMPAASGNGNSASSGVLTVASVMNRNRY